LPPGCGLSERRTMTAEREADHPAIGSDDGRWRSGRLPDVTAIQGRGVHIATGLGRLPVGTLVIPCVPDETFWAPTGPPAGVDSSAGVNARSGNFYVGSRSELLLTFPDVMRFPSGKHLVLRLWQVTMECRCSWKLAAG
jgi:hypothetical protein